MSLVLNGAGQYAYYKHPASIQGTSGSPLGTLVGYPQWWCIDIKPSTTASGFWVMQLSEEGGVQRCAIQHSGGTVKRNDGAAEQSAKAIAANAWQRILLYMASRQSTILYVDGSPGAEYATDTQWKPDQDNIAIGARRENSAPDLFFPGEIANVACGLSLLTLVERTGCLLGVNPRSMPGCVRFWELLDDADEFSGAWNLTLVGAPSFSSVDHPAVEAYPPSGGGVQSAGFSGGLIE